VAREVFVSYSSKDKVAAEAVREALERRALSCWMAPRDVQPGLEYGEGIIEGINRARVMVLVFSASANASPQIHREVERAVHKGLPIIPVRIEDVFPSRSLEYFLSSPHWFDALGPIESHLPRLTEAVKAMLVRVVEGTVSRPAPAPRRLFTRAKPVPVAVLETMPVEGLVPPPRLSRSALSVRLAPSAPVASPVPAPVPALSPPTRPAGVPVGLVVLAGGLLAAVIAAFVAHSSAGPKREAPSVSGSTPASRGALRPAAPQVDKPTPAEPTPAAPARTYECREGVRFQIRPDSAAVTINGRRVGTARDWSDHGDGRVYTFARPGTYQVRISQKGYATAAVRIVVRDRASRDVADVKLDLKRAD
jgi:hypothetical protein